MPITIHTVSSDSPAEKVGIRGGMKLVSVNGNLICDGLDYEFYTAGSKLDIILQDGDAQMSVTVSKPEYQPLGCVFSSYLADNHRHCKNACIFCFIDQLPKDMRSSLYFKDDDERLGFLFGNYVTLTNLTDTEIERIISMRFSPVNISVHTANPSLRVEMTKNPSAGKALSYIPKLAKAGIPMNFQLVLCPGINDGDELRNSLQWLSEFHPHTQSIAAVPVGLSAHRKGLYTLASYTKESASSQLDIMLQMGDEFIEKFGSRLIYPSDEWFLLAEREIPTSNFYDGYPQLENGVGMWRSFCDEFLDELSYATPPNGKVCADIATSVLSAPLMQYLADVVNKTMPDVYIRVHTIVNDFFGHSITVSGLLCGKDIIAQLNGKLCSQNLFLPPNILRSEGDLLLDDSSPSDIETALGVCVHIPPDGAFSLLQTLLSL